MKHWLAAGVMSLGLSMASGRAEEAFSRAIPPEDFAAAELGKLSPAALARLDELVQAYRSGAVAKARAESEARAAQATAEREQAREKEKAKAAAAETPAPGFFAKAKVLLAPGTKVEYGEIESQLAGDFVGWDAHTVFRLANGQRWRVANGDAYSTPAIAQPKVRIFPASFGGFWMKIEGVNPRVKVLLVSP